MAFAADVAKGQRVVGRPFNVAAGKAARGVAVDQQRQAGRWVIGVAATIRIGTLQHRQVQAFDDIKDLSHQMRLR